MRHDGDTLFLDGAVTMETVPVLLAEARAACRTGVSRVDFSGVLEADSAAIAFALQLKRDAADGKGRLAFVNQPASLQKLIELYDVEDHLGA